MRRGLSAVVATVLLILISVLAVALIAAFVLPFVNNLLDGSKECFDVVGKINIYDSPYNCYALGSGGQNRTGFSVQINDDKVSAFKVVLVQKGSGNTYTVKNGSSLQNVRLLDGTFGSPLEVPESGGVRTYVASGAFDSVQIFPVLASGKVCDSSDSFEASQCVGQNIIDSLLSS